MIRFSCPGCNRQFELPLTRSGKHGKCVQCGSFFQVPIDESFSGLVLKEFNFENEILSNLLKTFAIQYQNRVIEAKKIDSNQILLNLKTDQKRHQILLLSLIRETPSILLRTDFDYPYKKSVGLFVTTMIGEATTKEEMHSVLQYAQSFQHVSVVMDENWLLTLKRVIPDLQRFDKNEFAPMLLEMAICADKLEQILFSKDEY